MVSYDQENTGTLPLSGESSVKRHHSRGAPLQKFKLQTDLQAKSQRAQFLQTLTSTHSHQSMFKPSHILRIAQTSRLFLQLTEPIKNSTADMSRPNGLIANKGIELLTFGTPNGHKASIILEELKEAYGKDYTFQSISIMENIQKEPWFTKLCPNGRIPVIVDHDRGSFPVMEGAAILSYLTRHYDPDHKFNFTDPDDLSRAEQWVAWQHGGIGSVCTS